MSNHDNFNQKKQKDENAINDLHEIFCVASGFYCHLIANYCVYLHIGNSHD